MVKIIFIKWVASTGNVLDEGSTGTGRISAQNVSGTGIIIGENIKTGDISINVINETIKGFGLNLLPSTYFKDNQNTDENFGKSESGRKAFPLGCLLS